LRLNKTDVLLGKTERMDETRGWWIQNGSNVKTDGSLLKLNGWILLEGRLKKGWMKPEG
jgi:hypothetical protein